VAIDLTDSRIDVHSHYLPTRYIEMLRAAGSRIFGAPHEPTMLDQMIAGQDEAGVSTQILSTGPHSPYLRDEAAAIACAREVNDAYASVVDASKGRFAAFGSVPLPHVGSATAEACRCLDELGFAGIHLGCSILGRPLDDPEFDPFWQALNERDAIVFLHPGGILLGTEPGLAGMNDPLLAVIIGSAAEVATATIRLIGVRNRFPRIRFVIAILGGVLPYLYERLKTYAPIFGKNVVGKYTSRSFEEELREFYFDTTLDDDVSALIKARDVYGIDRILLGSDAPAKAPAKAIAFVKSSDFSATECDAILDHHAAGLFSERLQSARSKRKSMR